MITMPKLSINGTEIEVPAGTSVIQACEMLGVEVPRFCYHDKLKVAANCRMCLVEQKGAPKPVAACAAACCDGMEIETDSETVHKARQGVMEFLLINHPLDCPICDQGGECDLQDQAVAYGFDRSRYAEQKRAVADKELGPLIKTVMTRCIHCTRCIRFAEDVDGVPALGLLGRGENAEVGTYIEATMGSELSGNLADICPVGALTSKPFAFTARPWELRKTDSIDVLDAVGSNIRVDTRGREVMRILPRLHEEINEIWLGDKSRYAYDGLKYQRLDRPFIRKNGKLEEASWEDALAAAAKGLNAVKPDEIAALTGDLCDTESQFALLQMMRGLGVKHTDCRQDGADYHMPSPASYRLNTGIQGIENADLILLIGANPRSEAVMVNARIRKSWHEQKTPIYRIGEVDELTYPYTHLGDNIEVLQDIAAGDHPLCDRLKKAKTPMLILGGSALTRSDSRIIQFLVSRIAESYGFIKDDWNGYNALQTAAARVGGLDIGFLPAEDGGLATNAILDAARGGKIKAAYLLGADELDVSAFAKSFIIYQGHHGDKAARVADVILPGAAYTEKDALYVNMEGRPQLTRRAAMPPGEAKADWAILRALSERCGKALPYNTLGELRKALFTAHPHLGKIDQITAFPWEYCGEDGEVSDLSPFVSNIQTYYQTDPISRASKTMAECVRAFIEGKTDYKEVA